MGTWRQVLLVQLAERGPAAGGAGVPSHQAPTARCLRHLVAISKGGAGDAESIYSFSEVCCENFLPLLGG